ncbi:MAG: hypothetical protein JW800_07800, partial [Candidatus Omnitrophica bacterium]|nr:hypothetical protein [Candidatus Omnitrophota bacterium]
MKSRANVLIVSYEEEEAACYHIRILSPLTRFPSEDFKYIRLPSMHAVMNASNIPDIIYIRRNYHPLKFTERLLKFAKSNGIITVMDIDDLITDVPIGHPSLDYYRSVRDVLMSFMREVDYITVSTGELKKHLYPLNKNIEVLPNYLDPQIWLMKTRAKRDSANKKIVIGYAGSNTHVYDFEIVTAAIRHILSKYKGRV